MNSPAPKLRGLYLITPDEADTARLLVRVAAVLPYAALLQYRNKSASDALRRSQLLALLSACRAARVPLVVNDDWPLAIELAADGAHLGSDDGDLRRARSSAGPDFILGASCYDDLRCAEAATAAGANYLAFGAFHPSPTKPAAKRADTQLLRDGRRHGLPLVAIGGITPGNAPAIMAAGADMIAVISGVFDAVDPVGAARAYARHFELPSCLPPKKPDG